MSVNDASAAEGFQPEVYEERGFLFYRDGCVRGELQIGSAGELEIWNWSAAMPGRGHTTRALAWLRGEGYAKIVVIDATREAMAYWTHMKAKGCVDEIRPELASSGQGGGEKGGRHLGQLMPLEDVRFPVVVMRRTCTQIQHYMGRLPADPAELAEYKKNSGMDPSDVVALA